MANNVQFGSGRIFFVRDNGLMAQPFDTKRMEVTGTPELIAPQELEPDGAFFFSGFSVSQNGVVVFQSAADNISRLSWFDREGKELALSRRLVLARLPFHEMELCWLRRPMTTATENMSSGFMTSHVVRVLVCPTAALTGTRFSRRTRNSLPTLTTMPSLLFLATVPETLSSLIVAKDPW